MGSVVAVANIKGGVGKTTTVMFLAAEAVRAGAKVGLVDADPSGTLTRWCEALEDDPPFPVATSPGYGAGDTARKMADCDVVLVDCGPADRRKIESVLSVAALGVVPVGSSAVEAAELAPTMKLMGEARTPAAVLVVGGFAQTVMQRELDDYLDRQGWPRFRTVIPFRQSIRRAFGTLPGRTHGYREVWRELDEALVAVTRKVR